MGASTSTRGRDEDERHRYFGEGLPCWCDARTISPKRSYIYCCCRPSRYSTLLLCVWHGGSLHTTSYAASSRFFAPSSPGSPTACILGCLPVFHIHRGVLVSPPLGAGLPSLATPRCRRGAPVLCHLLVASALRIAISRSAIHVVHRLLLFVLWLEVDLVRHGCEYCRVF